MVSSNASTLLGATQTGIASIAAVKIAQGINPQPKKKKKKYKRRKKK